MRYLTTFFLRAGTHSRRTWWMVVLGLFPVGCAVLLWLFKPLLEPEGVGLWELYPQLGQLLYLDILLPLVAVFVGAAVIADEVDERTLPYLLLRPVPRPAIVLSKMLAGVITLGLILTLSLFCTWVVLVADPDSGGMSANISVLLSGQAVLLLGLVAYLPFFTLFGGLMKRPVLVGLLFIFGWERLVSALPGSIRLFSIAHYLHVLFPSMPQAGGQDLRAAIFGAIIPVREISDAAAVLIALGIAAVFTLLAALLPGWKEYRLDQGE